MGRRYRARSVGNVVDEFEYVTRQLKTVKEIFIEDDTFTINKTRVRDVCAEIERRELDVRWSCNARANLDYETMRMMKSAGCRLLDVGYESGSETMLGRMKKNITTENSKTFTKNAKKAGLKVLADFIIGLPGETKETAEETRQFVHTIRPDLVQFSIATPIPGTEFYASVKENGHLLVDDLEDSLDDDGFQKCIVSYPEFTKHDIEDAARKGLQGYYLSPSYVPIALKNVFRRGGIDELLGMAKSARLFFKYVRKDREEDSTGRSAQ